jgi:hypothetical protein
MKLLAEQTLAVCPNFSTYEHLSDSKKHILSDVPLKLPGEVAQHSNSNAKPDTHPNPKPKPRPKPKPNPHRKPNQVSRRKLRFHRPITVYVSVHNPGASLVIKALQKAFRKGQRSRRSVRHPRGRGRRLSVTIADSRTGTSDSVCTPSDSVCTPTLALTPARPAPKPSPGPDPDPDPHPDSSLTLNPDPNPDPNPDAHSKTAGLGSEDFRCAGLHATDSPPSALAREAQGGLHGQASDFRGHGGYRGRKGEFGRFSEVGV